MGKTLKKEKEMDLEAVLNTATKEKKSTKSTIPVVTVPEAVAKEVDVLRELKEQLESTQTMIDLKSAELVKVVSPQREKICKQEYTSSLKIAGTKGETITLTWKDAYSKVDVDHESDIKDIISDRYSEFFTKDMQIKAKEDISEQDLKDLIGSIGATKFTQYFEVERWIAPVKRYTTEFFNAFTAEEREKLSEVVHQYKPSIKTK